MSRIDSHNNIHDAAGQFAGKVGTRPTSPLLQPAPGGVDALLERRAILHQLGYLPASSTAEADLAAVGRIETWWERQFANAELRPDGVASYPKMPDDYTPKMSKGRSLSHHRRTHRMLYRGPETAVRMPSATSVKRFAADTGTTFDLPVEAEYPGGAYTGHVRVTANGDGTWSVSAMTEDRAAQEYVSESVQAVLENRAPSRGLAGITSILERRRVRLAAAGAPLKPISASSWVHAAGYNPVDEQLVVQLQGRVYGYHADRATYEALRASTSPGRAYNELVKGRERFEVTECGRCGRFYQAANQHRCASKHLDPRAARSRFDEALREHVAG